MGSVPGISVGLTHKVEFKSSGKTLRYKQRPIRDGAELRDAMRRVLEGKLGLFKPDPSRRFVTFGSCFAQNVALAMEARGANVYATALAEDVNCPRNNKLLLRRVFLGESSGYTDALADITGADFEALAGRFAEATDVIFTLGNIFHFPGGQLQSTDDLKRESFEDTVENIRDIIFLLHDHTKARLFVSVSPVPISGYRGPDFASAIEADCASKCQLVAALREIDWGFTYIPTFEIFRWLSAHQEFATFGDGEQHPRHIHRGHIAMVMELLCG